MYFVAVLYDLVDLVAIGIRAGGLGACGPPDSGKTNFWGAIAKFFSQQLKRKKYVYLLNENNGICSPQRDELPEIWGESGRAKHILNEALLSII